LAGTWFVMIPPGYASKTTAEKELVDFVISYPAGSAAWNAANSGQIVQGAEGNTGNPQVSEQLVKWQGPFATQAQAKAAANPQQQSPNPANDAVNAAQNATGSLGSLISALTSSNTWIRVVKVIVGGLLMVIGIVHITGISGGVADTARRVPLPV
jgi:hypothetical protein